LVSRNISYGKGLTDDAGLAIVVAALSSGIFLARLLLKRTKVYGFWKLAEKNEK